MANTNRIYLADMWTYPASLKAQGLKPYGLVDGELVPVLASRCRNRWGTIYLLTDDEYQKALAVEAQIKKLKEAWRKQLELADELMASTIVHNIIPQ